MRKLLLLTAILLTSISRAFCQDIYTYVAASTTGVPSYVDANIGTASNLTPIGTGTSTPCAMGFSGITGFTGASYSPAGACIQVSLTAAAGYNINAIGFTAHIRNSATGPTMVRLAYSADGGTTWVDDGVDYASLTGSCATTASGTNFINWSPFVVSNTSLLFRVYPFAAPGSGGTVQIYDLHIIGNVAPLCTILPSITASPAITNLCAGAGGVTLTASGAGPGGTYVWSPSATLSAATGSSVVATPGTSVIYTVTGTTSLGCHNTATAAVDIHALPAIPTLTVSGAATFCPGGSAVLNTPSVPGASYTWYNGSSPIPGAAGNSYTATATGNYTVEITNAFGCSATSAPVGITVASVPAAVITPVGSTSFCAGVGVELDAPTGAGYTYQWYNGSTAIPGAVGASYTYTGNGSIMVRVTNAFGCSRNSLPVTTTAIPLPFVAPGGPTSFCANGSVLLSVHVTGSSAGATYQWERGGAVIPGATSYTYNSNLTGSYQCVVNVAGGSCIDTTVPINVAVHATPSPAISFNGTLLSTSSHYLTYQWSVNGANITGATTYFVAPIPGIANGIYKVKVTDSTGCTGTSSPFAATSVIHASGVSTVSAANIRIYPNPATSMLIIESPVTVRAVITSIDGKIAIDQNDASELNITNLANGLYIIMLYDANNERIAVQKIVKQ